VKEKKETMNSAPAKVIVELPPEAKLTVDGQRISLSSGSRTVVTPNLEPGQDYYYIVKAEAVRGDKLVSDSKRVIVRAGQITHVDFGDLAMAKEESTGKPSRITVRLPDDAKLSVDGLALPMTTNVRTFTTPALEPGKAYYYNFKAEAVRNGQTQAQDRRVIVESGKELTVEFNDLEPLTTAQR
jgi:uncharacterized protein (TIGR03000 family)